MTKNHDPIANAFIAAMQAERDELDAQSEAEARADRPAPGTEEE